MSKRFHQRRQRSKKKDKIRPGRNRKRFHMEMLEDRRLLAAGTNYIYLDFTPDVIQDEWQPDPFINTFTTDGRRDEFYPLSSQFLDYNGDSVVDAVDAYVAADKISKRVHQRLRPFIEEQNLDVRVLTTKSFLESNDNRGKTFLDQKIEKENENAFVIYIGGDLKSINPDFAAIGADLSGVAIQGYESHNHEWYAYALAERTAFGLAKEHFERDHISKGASKVILDRWESTNLQSVFAALLDHPNPDVGGKQSNATHFESLVETLPLLTSARSPEI